VRNSIKSWERSRFVDRQKGEGKWGGAKFWAQFLNSRKGPYNWPERNRIGVEGEEQGK